MLLPSLAVTRALIEEVAMVGGGGAGGEGGLGRTQGLVKVQTPLSVRQAAAVGAPM